MPIRQLDDKAAVARLSSLRFEVPVAEAAQRLADWQTGTGGFVVPISVPLPRTPALEGDEIATGASYFKDRARQVRALIAEALGMDGRAAAKLTFSISSTHAWYLGPRPKLDRTAMLAAVAAAPAKFIELMLQRELIEAAAFDPEHVFVTGGFGPSVYLGAGSQATKKRLHLAEAIFSVNPKHDLLLCNVKSKIFVRKTQTCSTTPSASTLALDAGEGYMVGVTRLVPDDFFEVDARRYPMAGISLDTEKIRQSRLYYLNVLTEFALGLFEKAGLPVAQSTFVATHCVDDGYIPLHPMANLLNPLVVVNASGQSMDDEALKPLTRFPEFFPDGYHVAGNRKAQFKPPTVRAADNLPEELDKQLNFLFLNGEGDDDYGSVRVSKTGSAVPDWSPAGVSSAYAALPRGAAVADPYTQSKFRHLMECDTVKVSMQGLDVSPATLASVLPGKANSDNRQLQEALKRCLVELSLKESLLGHKPIPTPTMPSEFLPASLTLIATRQIRMPGRQLRKQLVSVVNVTLDTRGISVGSVRRSPWSSDAMAAIDFVTEFPFLQPEGEEWIRDGQFWVVDRETQERLTVWAGTFVPRIILNDSYASIEVALAKQDGFLSLQRQSGGGRYYSKGRDFNLLPYYMSMYRLGQQVRRERMGTRIAVQDCGSFLRVFVPPEGGIKGSGDSLSGMRDMMVYRADGTLIEGALLETSLTQLYLHTMTNGVLVGGDNSKMSVLEKLARLALEN
ncbi:hypothetical protein [Cupriavidus basilensis]|uniref:hypothetical protein n=1 Tax=Cupriavidus basilensis TaxID=68895 RepID=UPI001C2CF91B|nr:hypothetical protein [Cupriavidus basilensis]NUA30557.1 hypothetical protein [Cupriavidus basilensis]